MRLGCHVAGQPAGGSSRIGPRFFSVNTPHSMSAATISQHAANPTTSATPMITPRGQGSAVSGCPTKVPPGQASTLLQAAST